MSDLTAADFVHLHNHTQYSLLDGLTRITPLMETVKESGMSAVAMTDHGTLSGAIEFYKAGIDNEVKPIIGIETYIAARSHTDKDPTKDKNRYHLIILAMNETGYQNLMKLSTTANLDGFYYFPRIDHELLEKYNEGLIVLSACLGGEIGDALKQNQYQKAKDIASWYKKIFGDRYYLEIQDHGHPDSPKFSAEQKQVNDQIIKLGKELNIKIVVTCDAHYLRPEDQDAHEILLCVGTGSFLSDESRMSLKEFDLHVTDPNEVIKRWGETNPEFITNTKAIAERCDLNITLGEYHIPKFPLPKGQTERGYLNLLTYQGLVRRYAPDKSLEGTEEQLKKRLPKEIVERAEYELGVIERMGFASYFLVVQDFINWGKDKGIVFGPGRGSGAGSIVAYGLKITELDPLAYDLLFERFLNPDRISMPDFDIDIQDTRREEVIDYCVQKYGKDRVANIVTFGRMYARNAVRDVARVLQVPYSEADRLAKMIPPPIQGRHIPLEKSLKENAELANEYRDNPTSKEVLDQAMRLEGTIRSHGVHAAGVVIAPDDIVKFVPLEMAQKGVVATQYSMGPIEELGLLKMDFLGLSNLTIIKNALRIIKRVYKKDIDIGQIPLDDKKTFELLQRGDTTGVFQLESAGMKRYLKDLKPTVFEDIISMVALYRPGPMQWIDDFIARKHGLKKIEYLHPAMEPALKSTYGVIVTQEQVMQISKEMCGFTGGQADTLRKAIGKKIPEVMKKMKTEFIEGAIKTVGADRDLMERFWKQLEDFAAYCFNKAHSACYALIAYQTGYLKANYPEAFLAALMTSDFDNIDRLAIEITECRRGGIEVLPPDVNESFEEFAIVPDKKQIRFGLHAIKNVGANAVEEIVRVRSEKGKFESLEDFFTNVSIGVVNRKSIESLIKSGAFDSFGDRSQLLENIDLLMAYGNKAQKDAKSGQTDLFGVAGGDQTKAKLTLAPKQETYGPREQLEWERELLGVYLSRHPLDEFVEVLKNKTTPIKEIEQSHDGQNVTVGGFINDIREITTKNGQKMAFIKLADLTDEIELIIFPKTFDKAADMLSRDQVILATGKIHIRDRDGNKTNEIKIMVDKVKLADPKDTRPVKKKLQKTVPDKSNNQRIYVRLSSTSDEDQLRSLKRAIDDNPGETEVVLVVGDANKQIIRLPGRIDYEPGFAGLAAVVGEDHVKAGKV